MLKYKGEKYRFIRDLGEATGIEPSRLSKAMGLGLSVEDAVDACRRMDARRKENCTDHKGITYASVDDMCKAYGISSNLYRGRLQDGMSREEALTRPLRDTSIKAPNGETYPTKRAMCEAYGISLSTYANRIRRGMSVEQALTTPPESRAK